jgi:hypothetical protein
MVMVAVLRQDVYSGLCHSPQKFTELPRFILIQPLNHDLIFPDHVDSRSFESPSASRSIVHEKVRDSFAVHNEHAAALDADTCAAESLAHLSKGARPIFQKNLQVLHTALLPGLLLSSFLARLHTSLRVEA